MWPCLNPLAPHPADTGMATGQGVGDAAVENVVTVFSRLFSASWGFRTDDLLRVACLTLRAGPETPSPGHDPRTAHQPARARPRHHPPPHGASGTTAGTGRADQRGQVNAELARYWRWFASLSDPARAQVTAPLLNKLRALLLRPFARQLLCGGPSTINLTTVLDHGGVLLVRIPKGVLGEETTRLVGSLILAQTWQAATARAHRPQEERPDASIVIDECHNFLNLPYRIEDMLAEARGFRVGLTLAHQNLAQLPPELREGINTNARNKIMFSVSPDDATHLARHTLPELGRARPGPPGRLPRRRPAAAPRRRNPRVHPHHPAAADRPPGRSRSGSPAGSYRPGSTAADPQRPGPALRPPPSRAEPAARVDGPRDHRADARGQDAPRWGHRPAPDAVTAHRTPDRRPMPPRPRS